MNTINVGNQIDEADLDEELEALQQEQLDEQMLKTGTVPISDAVQRLPAAANGESETRPRPHRNFANATATNWDELVKGTPIEEEDDEEAELRKLQAEMAM
jgi:charged multivesicular body protein 4